MTGLFNRRYFNERIDTEVRRSARSGQTLSLVILDIDHFKKVNDQFGHLQGDKVLQLVAKAILQSVRRSDIVVRYGGEEIALILPDTSKRRAHQVCEQLRTAIAESTRQSSISDGLPKVTVSCGIAGFPDDGKYQKQIVEKADLALYSAKNKGRDRVEIYESSLS